jgi:hypothetical protein
MNPIHRLLIIAFTTGALACGLLPAATVEAALEFNPADLLLQQELRQEEIRATTERVGLQLDVIVDEYERNGLAGDDVSVLKAIRGVLGQLTEKEIRQVIGLLQQARTSVDPEESSNNTLNAFAGQKNVTVQLKHLLLEYQRQQILRELARRFGVLGRRQGVNLHETIALAKATFGRDARRSKESHRIALQLQSTEQDTINTEANSLLDRLEKVAAEMDGIAAEKPRAAATLARDGQLRLLASSATDDLKVSSLLSAAGNEKRARDLFVELARMLRPDRDKTQILKEAIKELDQAIAQQTRVAEQSNALTEKRPPDDLKEEIEKEQMKLVDQTDAVREDVEEVAPVAASALKDAITKMQEARAKLNDTGSSRSKSQPDAVIEKQFEALNKMAEARKDLAQQLEEAEKQSAEPEDKLQQMRKLLTDVQELNKAQDILNREAREAAKQPDKLASKSAPQSILKTKTAEAQIKAIPLLKSAAESLAEAAKQMEKAAGAMAAELDAPASRQAAADALKRAESQLAEEVSRLAQAEEQLNKLDQLGKKVSELIQQQQAVQLETAKAAEAPKTSSASETKPIAPKQAQLATQTATAATEAANDAPRAAEDLKRAQQNMAAADQSLQKPDAAKARQEQSKAINDLQSARLAIEQKKEELNKALGKPEEAKPDMLAQAAEAVTQAQLEVNKAANELARPASLAEFLRKQQENLAGEVADSAGKAASNQPLAAAQKSAAAAAAQVAKNDLAAASGEMAKAQSRLAEAAKAAGSAKADAEKLAQLAKDQGDLKDLAQELAKLSVQKATQPLDKANAMIAPVASGQISGLPLDAQLALRQAQQALTSASAQASANQARSASEQAQIAQETLSQAASALALAQKGLGNQSEQAQQMAQGEGGRGESKQQGKGEAKGPGKNKAKDDSKEGQGNGDKGNYDGEGGADGRRRQVADRNLFIGLPARERNAILQSMGERYPDEFSPLIEQYLKNLSDEPGKTGK